MNYVCYVLCYCTCKRNTADCEVTVYLVVCEVHYAAPVSDCALGSRLGKPQAATINLEPCLIDKDSWV